MYKENKVFIISLKCNYMLKNYFFYNIFVCITKYVYVRLKVFSYANLKLKTKYYESSNFIILKLKKK